MELSLLPELLAGDACVIQRKLFTIAYCFTRNQSFHIRKRSGALKCGMQRTVIIVPAFRIFMR